jgi:tetrapyrrole methylase family protein/MazG family protein
VLDGIPAYLPSLAKADKLQHKASKAGFDWKNADEVWEKLDEELAEVKEAIQSGNTSDMEDEFGDVLFVIANIMRFYDIHPEVALNRSNAKFRSRFTYVEEQVKQSGKTIQEASMVEMDAFWQKAKERE